MPSFMSPFICGTRNLLSQGFRSLPVLLGGAILVLGLSQGNINLLFFFVGLCILAPTSALIINMLWELIFSNTPQWLTPPEVLWKLPDATASACAIYSIDNKIPPVILNVVPSYWVTMISFFVYYLYINAATLYTQQSSSKAPESAVLARKSQTMSSMILIITIYMIIILLRYSTGCETALGMFIAYLLGTGIAYGWHSFMRSCGLGRLDDIFGISNRILPQQSYEAPDPTVCAAAN